MARGAREGAPLVQVTYWTDPLCSWSWALEPSWLRVRSELGSQLTWRYRMGGMIRDWARFEDPVNGVGRPQQLKPLWYEVALRTGVAIDERLWDEDPPASSYPACLAVKAAELQGAGQGERYLRALREAAMLQRRNIARDEVLLEVGEEVAAASIHEAAAQRGDASLHAPPCRFDADRFAADLAGQPAREGFRHDIMEARYHEVGRFPTLVLRSQTGADPPRALMVVGWRPYEALRAAIEHAAPNLVWREDAVDAELAGAPRR